MQNPFGYQKTMFIALIVCDFACKVEISLYSTKSFWRYAYRTVVVGHGSQSMMGLSIDLSSVAMNLRTVRISKSKKK